MSALRGRLDRLEAALNPPPPPPGLAARMRDRLHRALNGWVPQPRPLSEVPVGSIEWKMRTRAERHEARRQAEEEQPHV